MSGQRVFDSYGLLFFGKEAITLIIIYQHPQCSTCRKARAWFDNKGIAYHVKDIRKDIPSKAMLKRALAQHNGQFRKVFNTSGAMYRQQKLRLRIDAFSLAEAANVLHSDGMLIKRPLITDGKQITNGFNENEYEQVWNNGGIKNE